LYYLMLTPIFQNNKWPSICSCDCCSTNHVVLCTFLVHTTTDSARVLRITGSGSTGLDTDTLSAKVDRLTSPHSSIYGHLPTSCDCSWFYDLPSIYHSTEATLSSRLSQDQLPFLFHFRYISSPVLCNKSASLVLIPSRMTMHVLGAMF
jgi:hypothetical protein